MHRVTSVVICLALASCGRSTRLTEQPGTNNTNSTNSTNTVDPRAPDLQVASFGAAWGDERYPNRIKYDATICNRGDIAAGFAVHFYRNRTTRPQLGDRGDQIVHTQPIAANECREVSALDDGLPNGHYNTWVQVDPFDEVDEPNEQNNTEGPIEVFLSSDRLPDLHVALSFTKEPGGVIVLNASVCNAGQAPAGQTRLGFYIDLKNPPQQHHPPDATLEIMPTEPNDCRLYEVIVELPPGKHTAWAMVDPHQEIAESNEQNNTDGPVAFSVGTGPLADLVIPHFDVAGNASGGASFKATVCNYGKGLVSTDLAIYYDRSSAPPVLSKPNQTYPLHLPPGVCDHLGGPISIPPGTYEAWAFVDNNNYVIESNENNNIAGPVSYTVGNIADIDLTVISLSAKSSSSNSVQYSATVCNYGTDNATGVNLGLYHHSNVSPGPFMTPDKTIYLSMVPSGACVTVSEVSYLQPGSYNSWAVVDPNDKIPEVSENNNIIGPVEVLVGYGQADLKIATFIAGAAVGGGFYGAQVCNEGGTASGPVALGIFFSRTTAPVVGDMPDHTVAVPGLASGTCQHAGSFVSLPIGSYNSWMIVDIYDGVTESDETNNVAGPQSFAVGGTETPCETICAALVSPCNLLPSSEQQNCITGCDSQQPEVVACALEATTLQLCDDILQCLFGTP